MKCRALGCDTRPAAYFGDGAGRWHPLCEHHGDLLAVGFPLRPVQTACDRCTPLQRRDRVMDADNPHVWGECECDCHTDALEKAQ